MSGPAIRSFGNIDRGKLRTILDGLISHGSVVQGDNPWTVDTRKHGVVLLGAWNEESSTLTITVEAADWYVPHEAVWDNVDTLMNAVQRER